jgi:hypothetical protein
VCSSHTAPIFPRQNHFKKQLQKTVESALKFKKLRKFYALNQTHPAETGAVFSIFVFKLSTRLKTVSSYQNFSQLRKICVISTASDLQVSDFVRNLMMITRDIISLVAALCQFCYITLLSFGGLWDQLEKS